MAEELRAGGADVHLAEPAETGARPGNMKRANSDRGDARHLRQLLMIGRLPELDADRPHGLRKAHPERETGVWDCALN